MAVVSSVLVFGDAAEVEDVVAEAEVEVAEVILVVVDEVEVECESGNGEVELVEVSFVSSTKRVLWCAPSWVFNTAKASKI